MAEAKTKKYRALSTLIGLDKKPTKIGAVVDLDDDTAADLLAAKVIEPVATKAAAADAETK